MQITVVLLHLVCVTALAIHCILLLSALTKIPPKQTTPQELLRNLNNHCLVSANLSRLMLFYHVSMEQ